MVELGVFSLPLTVGSSSPSSVEAVVVCAGSSG